MAVSITIKPVLYFTSEMLNTPFENFTDDARVMNNVNRYFAKAHGISQPTLEQVIDNFPDLKKSKGSGIKSRRKLVKVIMDLAIPNHTDEQNQAIIDEIARGIFNEEENETY